MKRAKVMKICSKDCVLLVSIYIGMNAVIKIILRHQFDHVNIILFSGKGFSPVMKKRLEKLGIDPTKDPEDLTTGKC